MNGEPQNSEDLSVQYDGPSLAHHCMDIRDLAPALSALSDMFAAAHRQLADGWSPPPALLVTAQREGSFAVELILAAADSLDTVIDLFSGRKATAASTAIALTTPVFGALGWLALRARRGDEESRDAQSGHVRVTWADGTMLETTTQAAHLVDSLDFRRAAREAVAPLTKEGIDSLTLRRTVDKAAVHIERADLQAFDFIEPDETLLSETTREVGLKLVSVAFKETHKWRVNDGSSVFWASVEDLRFLQRISDNQEAFSRDDVLRCRLRERQFQAADGALRVDHIIEEVLRHLPATVPEPFPGIDERHGPED